MNRHKFAMERQINDRLFQFIVPSESPLNECLMVVDDIRKYILERIEQAAKEAQKAKEQEQVWEDGHVSQQ